MVAKITTGKSLRGLIIYNEKKVKLGEAKVLMAKGFPKGMESSSTDFKLIRFKKLLDLNRRTKTNAVHISLNFSLKDKIDDKLLAFIANEYMERIGFGAQPWMVYRHFDAGHPHIHIVSVNINEEGKRIETHNLGKNQSEKARKELEIELGLIKAEDQKKDYLLRAPLEKAEYGVAETKSLISSIVTEVYRTYSFRSFAAYNAALSQFRIEAVKAGKTDESGNQHGLLYFILDSEGKRCSVPVKASSIHSRPTLSKIQKKADQERKAKPDKGLINRLEAVRRRVSENNGDLEAFILELKKNAIGLKTAFNGEGRLYGTTYIDNIHRKVYKGSDLGKEYTAEGLSQLFLNGHDKEGDEWTDQNRLDHSEKQTYTQSKGTLSKPETESLGPDLEQIAYMVSWKIPEGNFATPDPFRRKRRRKKKGQL
ncbi:Putative conjugative transposon mobilization protein [Indibacter alkaliphilus LW1]|uniref:Conjugative transposon mobilization protein n=1 Tax=Indibacter alkaliphilus (strain CCUG 57479 / KCTC 22604 / LW1) TaxID=1189612 RepID=S2E691_INDAL|nr:relaxase/mobilization nuclease domain-containing protein [Indibacter alkaliphilus]EOZ97793.1 Putative conjugative transposon mobilization protein [Indibacter alkaliphilus LW1]